MFLYLKNYVIDYIYVHRTKVNNIDNDFWDNLYLYEIEEGNNV